MPQQDLDHERLILRGLTLEWEYARDFLDPRHAAVLRRPVFRLSEMESRLGSWCGVKREIVLSRRLAREHPWFAVREVLLHEMAHQLAEEVLGGGLEMPHGPRFREACRLLRANPASTGSPGTLHGNGPVDLSDSPPENRALRRAGKLLALAGSANMHEAHVAMTKAHELMRKYNMDLIRSHPARTFQSMFLGQPALRHGIEKSLLANLVQDFYFVSAVWVPVYVTARGRMGRALEASGTRENVTMAAHVFDFVTRYIDDQWKKYRKASQIPGARKSEFGAGVIEGLRSRLESMCRTNVGPDPGDERGLVRLADPLLREYIRDRYPCLRTSGRSVKQGSEKVRKEGMQRGRELSIHRPMESECPASGGYLLS